MTNLVDDGLAAKASGNDFFKNGDFKKAITEYHKAIDCFEDHVDQTSRPGGADDMEVVDSKPNSTTVEPDAAADTSTKKAGGDDDEAALKQVQKDIAICYSNRAFCHIKMENFGSAICDAEAAIAADENYPKGYYRLGCSKYALGKYKDAQRAFKKLCLLSPQDKDARAKLKECDKMVQQQKFALAISTEATESYVKTALTNFQSMTIDSTYTGPIYPGCTPSTSNTPDDTSKCAEFELDPTTSTGVRCDQPGKGLTREWVLELMKYMKEEKTIHRKCGYRIVLEITELLKKCNTIEYIGENLGEDCKEFTVCGDVHGQFYDLLNIWEINGWPSETNPYLFNGDFVDRGSWSAECILALFVWKLLYPTKVHLSRGNHETKNMNKLYGFEGEIRKKFDANLYNLFCETFCYLPLAHVLRNEVFIVHGGLFSVDNVTLEDLNKEDRLREPPEQGRVVEMLWSDPCPTKGRFPSRRGVGVNFGPDVTENFLKTNNLSMVVRSHEMKDEGYEVEHDGKLITIFSAPNYCDQMKNKGAFIRYKLEKDAAYCKGEALDVRKANKSLNNMSFKIVNFADVPHPSVKPMQYANPMLGSLMGM